MSILGGITRAAHALIDHTGITGVGGGGGGGTTYLEDVTLNSSPTVGFTGSNTIAADGSTDSVYGALILPTSHDAAELYAQDGSTYADIWADASPGRVELYSTNGLLVPSMSIEPDVADSDPGQVYYNTLSNKFREYVIASNPSDGMYQDLGSQGWAPFAYPMNFVPGGTYTTAVNLAANGGSMAIPFVVSGPMNIDNFEFYNTDTTGVREWEVAFYLDNGHSSSAVRTYDGNEFGGGGSVSGAGIRVIGGGFSSALRLASAGIVWAVLRNTHATNTLGVGTLAPAGTLTTYYSHQTKTLGSFLGIADTLDLVTGWTKATGIPCAVLRGNVLDQSSAY